MEILKKTTSIVAALIICSNISYASWKSTADSMVAIQSSDPASLSTSLTSSFSGGGVRVKWRSLGNVNLINASSPKFSAGCNGVEIGFGSISFLDFESLVDKLKMIASQAPAFAFKMAIDTACSQCSTIMQDLEDTVEAINSFSLDACGIAENLGNSVGSSLGSIASTGSSRYGDTYEAQKSMNENKSSFKTNELKDLINSWSDTINGKSLKLDKLKGYGSFLNNLRINKIPALNNYEPKEFIEVIRSMVGDVVGYIDENKENEDTYTYIQPTANISDLIKLFAGISGGRFPKTVITLVGNNSEWEDVVLTNMPTGLKVNTLASNDIVIDDFGTGDSSTKSWTYNIKESIASVVGKIIANTELTSSDLTYLQNLPYNGYKIVNHYASIGFSNSSLPLEDYARYIALENIKSEFSLILDLAERSLAEYSNEIHRDTGPMKKDDLIKYDKVLKMVREQKKLLASNEYILMIPAYIKNINEAILKDIPKNRAEKVE
jgi:conjugative transfer pilus assembly protein TraH